MTLRCPRCESYDVHRSRQRGGLEHVPALLGLVPRRCSACGWRGLRVGSSASSSSCRTDAERAARLEREHRERRSRRHRESRKQRFRSPAARRLQALVLAVALGLGTGAGAHACFSGDTVAND